MSTITNTFDRPPEAATFDRWREQAPSHFLYVLYVVTTSRVLTPRDAVRLRQRVQQRIAA